MREVNRRELREVKRRELKEVKRRGLRKVKRRELKVKWENHRVCKMFLTKLKS